MHHRWIASLVVACTSAAFTAWSFGCGDDKVDNSAFQSPAQEDAAVPPGPGPFVTSASDFPAAPIIDANTTPAAPALFGGAKVGAAGGPCLMEPEPGAMLPRNWLRPRFLWIGDLSLADGGDGATKQNLFELKVHADNQKNDLVVYTSSTSWTMPESMWNALRLNSADVAMTVSVRGGVLSAGVLANVVAGSTGPLRIAPVEAPGTIVYWTSIAGGATDAGYNPVLKGFRVGDESVADVLKPAELPKTNGAAQECLGCHSSTPDGLYAAVSQVQSLSAGGGNSQVVLASVDGKATAPPFLTAEAKALLERPNTKQNFPAFSPAHYQTGDRVVVTSVELASGSELVWTDLETKSQAQGMGWGVFARSGDVRHGASATVSHDGKSIVYVSTLEASPSGAIVNDGELWTIPYGQRAGGAAQPLGTANSQGYKQYFPSFSPDDKLVVFNRAPKGTSSYNDPNAELFVVPSGASAGAGGGAAVRSRANDPPACSGAKSPGTHNSWPKWSPAVRSDHGKDYYFVVFSSSRNHGDRRFGDRLYVTPVVVDHGKIETYASLYLWNQPAEDNHSPAWDELKIPDVPVK